MPEPQYKSSTIRFLDIAFIIAGLAILILFTTLYQMPFRLDDVLHMDWAREHSFWDAFNVQNGEIVRSVRPVFAMTIWLLTHTAGIDHYFPWHFVLVGSFLIGLAYAGKTARYLANDNSALYFTTGFFWLAFLPILNVLFWYGDLTFTIELMFVAPAWYYGLRGLLEGKIGFWIAGVICGIFAILAKEPAILLVHSIFAGTFILLYHDIKIAWSKKSKYSIILALGLYILFLLISLKLYFASPTRSNRFFDVSLLSHDKLMYFINDRIRYYGETLLNPIARILLVTPLLYTIFAVTIRPKNKLIASPLFILIAALLSFLFVKSIVLFAFILLIAPAANIFMDRKSSANKIIFLFSLAAIVILSVLLITVMLVKTQLTELSFVLLIISGVYWSQVLKDIAVLLKPFWTKRSNVISAISLCFVAMIAGIYFAFPIIMTKEHLLRDVRDVRSNANDAIQWMGSHIPSHSEILVTAPSLYGLGGEDDMTSKDDRYKLYAQYTFLQGYTRSYFRALARDDLSLGYLEDSVKLNRVLDSCRNLSNYYLFLQTGLDVDRFHSEINGNKQLKMSDSLLAIFSKGPFPCEIWKIGK